MKLNLSGGKVDHPVSSVPTEVMDKLYGLLDRGVAKDSSNLSLLISKMDIQTIYVSKTNTPAEHLMLLHDAESLVGRRLLVYV